MTREQQYTAQLQALGIWDDAFAPEVHELATLERELSRARKQWKATAPKGEAPSVLSEYYSVICALRKDILAHRDSLGLTPKGLKRLRGKDAALTPEQATEGIASRLDDLLERTRAYE